MKIEDLGFTQTYSDKYQTNWRHPGGCMAHIKRNFTGPIRWTYYAFNGLVQCGGHKYRTKEEAYNTLVYVLDYKKNKLKDIEFFP